MEKLKALAKSRKFWAAVLGVGVVVLKGLRPDFPMSDEQLLGMWRCCPAILWGRGWIRSGRPLNPFLSVGFLWPGLARLFVWLRQSYFCGMG